ncbi:hypothetical protein RhiirA4_549105 [Rhizophagus irregularis]|uniref:Uncharacterized protein n=1 Tax=Rhizophagus irregularis TaxID=588596 RepID=A0A2I1HB95_9GLOM|nr:hypothetical protein RhiirA4_549105 [Rhizophagus irregularis]
MLSRSVVTYKENLVFNIYEFKYSRHDEIKEMHAIYEVQFPLFHAQIMIIGLCYAKRCERREALFNVYRVYRKFRLCWIVLALSTWNTLRCYRNFNNTVSRFHIYLSERRKKLFDVYCICWKFHYNLVNINDSC